MPVRRRRSIRLVRASHQIKAQMWNGVLVESHHFSPDLEVELPKHSHGEYQIGLAPTHEGEYRYRGGYHPVPVGSISVIQPGEVHSGCGFRKRTQPIVFYSFYVRPEEVANLVSRQVGEERIRNPILLDPRLERELTAVHQEMLSGTVSLGAELTWHRLLNDLFASSGTNNGTHVKLPEARPGVRRVRELLDAYPDRKFSLEELARVARLTSTHLSRSFHEQVGLSLHRYQMQARVGLAKRLLLEGVTPAEAALRAGFTHQSHMGKHFRALTNTSPYAYQTAKS